MKYTEAQQEENRKKKIPVIRVALEIRGHLQKIMLFYTLAIVIGFFMMAAGIISIYFVEIVGLVLIVGSIYFSKKDKERLREIEEKYGLVG